MKYPNILVLSALLLSSSVLAKFVGVPLPRTPPPLTEPEEEVTNRSSFSNINPQARPEIIADALRRLLAKIYTNAAMRSDQQAAELRGLIPESKIDPISKTNLRAALLIGKLASQRNISATDVSNLEKIARRSERLSQPTIIELLNLLRDYKKRVPYDLVDNIKRAKAYLKKQLMPEYGSSRLRDNNNDD